MGLILEIDNTTTAAFADRPECEVAEILRRVADKIEQGYAYGYCLDTNGNKVGDWTLDTDFAEAWITNRLASLRYTKSVAELDQVVMQFHVDLQRLFDDELIDLDDADKALLQMKEICLGHMDRLSQEHCHALLEAI